MCPYCPCSKLAALLSLKKESYKWKASAINQPVHLQGTSSIQDKNKSIQESGYCMLARLSRLELREGP
jgi:hypothetical protein